MAKEIKDLAQRKFILLTDEMYKALKDDERAKQLTESSEYQATKTLDSTMEKLLANKTITPDRKSQMYSMILKNFQNFRSRAPELNKEIHKDKPVEMISMQAEKPEKSMSDMYIDDDDILEDMNYRISSTPDYRLAFDTSVSSEELLPKQQDATAENVDELLEQQFYAAVSPPLAETPSKQQVAAKSSPLAQSSSQQRQDRYRTLKEQVQSADRDVLTYDGKNRELILFGHHIPHTNIDDILNHVSNHKPSDVRKPEGVGLFLEAYGAANLDVGQIANTKLRNIAKAALPQGYGKNFRVITWVNHL